MPVGRPFRFLRHWQRGEGEALTKPAKNSPYKEPLLSTYIHWNIILFLLLWQSTQFRFLFHWACPSRMCSRRDEFQASFFGQTSYNPIPTCLITLIIDTLLQPGNRRTFLVVVGWIIRIYSSSSSDWGSNSGPLSHSYKDLLGWGKRQPPIWLLFGTKKCFQSETRNLFAKFCGILKSFEV